MEAIFDGSRHRILLRHQGNKPGIQAVLAQAWIFGFITRQEMSIKGERKRPDMRIPGRIAGGQSPEQSVWCLLSKIS